MSIYLNDVSIVLQPQREGKTALIINGRIYNEMRLRDACENVSLLAAAAQACEKAGIGLVIDESRLSDKWTVKAA